MTVRRTRDTMTGSIDRMVKKIDQLPEQAYAVWLRETPVRSGNARRRTRLVDDTIRADYPYAQRLDQGWSRQAPEGMLKPTEKFIQQQLKKTIRK